ncbi:adenylate/guanylate cyclase domain-containing protein [Reyranella soli]|uniref:Adenylate/guanylate cyclase domain-containing protein n=1 Tax=Reyranella soli TaxID=1230389 RepID=A0A512NI21_9HYPH|nr:adenylate/guanylate cyclase domain-containing protein [Reyranella soli]GEP58601.1 adenylate/guanylate cyclase domain-containing protein [Reyranella soli]
MLTKNPELTDRDVRWGLAVKLFAILLLLGAIAVLVTSIMGYLRARDSLQEAIYNQLTTARKSKARQVETYFRTLRNELGHLASTQMAVDAARGFNSGFEALEKSEVPADTRRAVDDWYVTRFAPDLKRILGKEPDIKQYFPDGNAAYYLQYHYIVANPDPPDRRLLLDDAHDGSAWSRQHAVSHPLLRSAAKSFGFFDLNLIDARTGRIVYGVLKEVDLGASLRTGLYRQTNLAAAVARCATTADRSAICFEDFAPYAPSGGAPIAFMAAPIVDQGQVIAVLAAQLSIQEIDNVVTGDRQWRQDGFGATGEAYLVGADSRVRSAPRAFYENRDLYFAGLKSGGQEPANVDAIRRYGTPVLHQHIDTEATRAGLAGLEGTSEIAGYDGRPTLASWGPLGIPGTKWALIAKIDSDEALAPIRTLQRELTLVGGLALVVVLLTSAWLSRSLLGPLRELTAGVRLFAAGDYGAKVTVRARDEIGTLCAAFNRMVDQLREKNVLIENKNREIEELLLNVLPAPIANRLRGGEQSIADGFAEVTVGFADIEGFTQMSAGMPPADVVALLNGLFSRFDDAAHELGIEKIKTVGDAYMAVCGLPDPVPDHTERMVRMAIRMVYITREHAMQHKVTMKLRVGVNSGPVVAGVIGKSKYIYDLWGDTVNLASRMESGGLPDMIQVTRPVYEKLKDQFVFEPRGAIEVKGKGLVEAWLLKL